MPANLPDSLTADLAAAITALRAAPDTTEARREAWEAYGSNPRDEAASARLIELLGERSKLTDPIDSILAQAWREALAHASQADLLKPADGSETSIFEDVWAELLTGGWKKLPDYRHDNLCEAFTIAMRHSQLESDPKPDETADEIAARMLSDIARGRLPRAKGPSDILRSFAAGEQLSLEMEDWAPRLTYKGQRPAPMPHGLVFKTELDFPSGRVLVADAIRIDPLPDLLSELRSALGLNINYAMHRVLRTVQCVNTFGTIDIAMGDDGPGLVRAPEGEIIFAGHASDDFPEIASVCHDYWGTTMIDRARLAETMLKKEAVANDAEAQARIDEWLADSHFHTEVEMPAGNWHLYWDDDRETLDAQLKAAGIEAPKDTRFVLSRTPLDLAPDVLRDFGALLKD